MICNICNTKIDLTSELVDGEAFGVMLCHSDRKVCVDAARADQRRKDQTIAKDIEDHAWAVYKGQQRETDILKRADPYAQGYSDGAGEVARKILEGAREEMKPWVTK